MLALTERLGDYEEIDRPLVAALTRGDRQALVLAVRRALYGDRLSLVVRCPNPACLALSDIDLQITELAHTGGAARLHPMRDDELASRGYANRPARRRRDRP